VSTMNWGDLQKTAADATRLLEDGPYPVEVTSAEATSSKAGNPQIKVKVRVCDGPATGRALFTQMTVSDSGFGLAMFFRSLAALGVTADVLASGPSLEQVAAALVGRKALANVDHSTYQGVERNGIKDFAPDPNALGQGVVVIAADLGSGNPGSGVAPVDAGIPSQVPSSVPTSVQTPASTVPSDVPVPSF
jgi:hypothetical protein